jgi:hypothetical protein
MCQNVRTSWESVFRSVQMAVEWGQAHQDLSGVRAVGIAVKVKGKAAIANHLR